MSRLILEGLLMAEKEGRLHHAYLLCGPESPAKLDCVQKLAASFSSSDALLIGGGDEEASFERICRGNHPDFLLLQPENELINVEMIRGLPKALSFSPLESSRRVVVIAGAQCMNTQASNALLKILEEPPGHTMFFLLSREPSELLQTIVSRCQVLRFSPLSPDELMSALKERDGAEAVISWSDGSLARAEALLQAEGGIELMREACVRLLELWEASPRIPSATFQWLESVASEEACQITLDSWDLLLRDFAFTASGAQKNDLRFPEFHGRLCDLAGSRNYQVVDEVAVKSSAINRFRVYRQFNGNLRLDFAALLPQLQVFSIGKAGA